MNYYVTVGPLHNVYSKDKSDSLYGYYVFSSIFGWVAKGYDLDVLLQHPPSLPSCGFHYQLMSEETIVSRRLETAALRCLVDIPLVGKG